MNGEARPLRPEEDLLLCSARAKMTPEHAGRIRALLEKDLDWAYLLRMAHPHGMSPLLYRHLEAIGRDRVPHPVLEQLHAQVLRTVKHNLRLAAELRAVVADLESHGMPVILLKGPVLARQLYGDLALRPSRDLDLLVRREDLDRATARLVMRGYRRQTPIPARRESAFLRAECAWTLEHAATGTLVELHWGVTPPHFACRLDLDQWWARAEQTAFGDRPVLTLAKEETLLFLSVHGAKHCWERLEWICDVARLVERDGIQWDAVLKQARAAGACRMLLLGLLLAAELVDAPVPESLLREARSDSAANKLVAKVRHRLFRGGHTSWTLGEMTRFHLQAKERWRDRASYLIGLATPRSTDWGEWPLPTRAVWPYYVLRPVRLAVKYGGRWLRQLSAPRTAICDQ